MTTQYEKLLATVPCFGELDRRELRIVARLVDVVLVPAGEPISPPRGETIAGVEGATTTDAEGRTLALTPLRLYVFGRRELRSLRDELPDVARRIRSSVEAMPSDSGRRSRPPERASLTDPTSERRSSRPSTRATVSKLNEAPQPASPATA